LAIPSNTTFRQLEAVGRWILAGVVIVGTLSLWYPGYRLWGALTAAVGLVTVLWFVMRTHAADRTVPGHPFHAALLGPAGVLLWHLGRASLTGAGDDPLAVCNALNTSMIFQLGLLSLAVMLAQSLLPRAAGHFLVLSACGAAMMGGTAAAIVWGHGEAVRGAIALLGFAGVCVWLSPLWVSGGRQRAAQPPGPLRRLDLRIFYAAVGAGGAAALAFIAPQEALLAGGLAGATVFLGGLVFPRGRSVLLVGGGCATVAAVVAARLVGCPAMSLGWLPDSFLGRGEQAFRILSASDSGLAILAGTVGWCGLVWLLVGLAASIVCLMWRVRASSAAEQARAMVWTLAVAMLSCALLAPAGLYIPAVTIAAAFAWGLLPSMLAREARHRSAAFLLGPVIVLMIMQALVRKGGLLEWCAMAYGWEAWALHVCTGFFLALSLSWYLGATSARLGLLAVAVTIAAGGAGELLQGFMPGRGSELADWLAHSAGAIAAIPLYLLAVGSRWCESPDARAKLPTGPCGAP